MTIPNDAGHPAHILIVDDELTNRQLLEVMLAPQGYVLEHASNGVEALAAVERRPPDLILLDVMMPGMDGFQVATRIKRSVATRNIPIVMVTAMDDPGARMLGLGVGVEDFLSKPVDRGELCARVLTLVRFKALSEYYEKHRHLHDNDADPGRAHLVESARLDQATFDAAPVGIACIDFDGKLVRVNQRLCEMLGYSRKDALAMAPRAFLRSEEPTSETESIRQLWAGTLDRHTIAEKKYVRHDGSAVWARLNMSVQRDKDGKPRHLISVIEEVTERRLHATQARKKTQARQKTK